MWKKFVTWWYFHLANPVIRKGESGGFRWCFRRFWLEISSLSGNFKARFTASEHPTSYLLAGKTDDNIVGFCEIMYTVGMLLTRDQGFVNDINKAIQKYDKRLQKSNAPKEDEAEERIDLEYVKGVQDFVEQPKSERSKRAKAVDKKFKAAARNLQKEE
jgi:hypothetical protein